MGRAFDGTNDRLDFGTDASIDQLNPISIACWILRGAAGVDHTLVAKDRQTAAWAFQIDGTNVLRWRRDFSGTDGTWDSTNTITGTTAYRHVAMTYDRGATANVPALYIDGAAETVVTTTLPVGTANSDATPNLVAGETGAGSGDFNGRMGWLTVRSGVLSPAEVNRHKWWGCAPGGPSTMEFWQPMWAADLNNKGSGTAAGSATGTTVVDMPVPVVRPGSAMMGMGIGW